MSFVGGLFHFHLHLVSNSHVDPEMLGKDTSAKSKHDCYACVIAIALEHIAREGVHMELIDHHVFDSRANLQVFTNPKIKIDSYHSYFVNIIKILMLTYDMKKIKIIILYIMIIIFDWLQM